MTDQREPRMRDFLPSEEEATVPDVEIEVMREVVALFSRLNDNEMVRVVRYLDDRFGNDL